MPIIHDHWSYYRYMCVRVYTAPKYHAVSFHYSLNSIWGLITSEVIATNCDCDNHCINEYSIHNVVHVHPIY